MGAMYIIDGWRRCICDAMIDRITLLASSDMFLESCKKYQVFYILHVGKIMCHKYLYHFILDKVQLVHDT